MKGWLFRGTETAQLAEALLDRSVDDLVCAGISDPLFPDLTVALKAHHLAVVANVTYFYSWLAASNPAGAKPGTRCVETVCGPDLTDYQPLDRTNLWSLSSLLGPTLDPYIGSLS